MTGCCPHCDIDLDDDGTQVRCARCGWAVRDVDDPRRYGDLSADVHYARTGSWPA